ncbi:MAG TPA: hypothetical protein VN578_24250 [Candidatus Binatia bacterium]|nr:hypothetical protein [Candidatus Binatia bacterium]
MSSAAWKMLFGFLALAGFFSASLESYGALFTFSSTNVIVINETGTPPIPAAPYPASLSVTGLNGLVVTKLTVTLHGLTHTFPSDINILLLGPLGQRAIIMAQTGGQDRYSVTNLSLTLDDNAATPLPIYTSLTSGTFQPTDGYLSLGYPHFPYDFPAPAPPGNSNSLSALSVFKNTDPTGQWSLFVVADSTGDSGSISGGWSLNLSVAVPLQVTRSPTNIIVSWPASAPNCSLQTAPDISASGGWTNIPTIPHTNLGRVTVTNPIYPGKMFFRLVGY